MFYRTETVPDNCVYKWTDSQIVCLLSGIIVYFKQIFIETCSKNGTDEKVFQIFGVETWR